MMSVRHAEKLTKARSLFRDKKRYNCLTFLNATISFDNRRGCSRASATEGVALGLWRGSGRALSGTP